MSSHPLKISSLLKDNSLFLLFIALMLICRSSLADWYHVPSGSMRPTIIEGDRIWVDKLAYGLQLPFSDVEVASWSSPSRGDVIVFESAEADKRLIKRVVAVAGDTVAMVKHQLWINGVPADMALDSEDTWTESFRDDSRRIRLDPVRGAGRNFENVLVPKGHVLVLGDNRANSADSRVYGFVPVGEIQGRATKVVVSLNRDNFYLPRDGRLMVSLM